MDRSPLKAGNAASEPQVTETPVETRAWCSTTKWKEDYAIQGHECALFVSEIIAELDNGPAVKALDPGLKVPELEPVLLEIISSDPDRQWKLPELVSEVHKRKPGRTTSDTQIQRTAVFNKLLEDQGRKRPGRKTKAEKAELERLISQSMREDDADNEGHVRGKRIRSRD